MGKNTARTAVITKSTNTHHYMKLKLEFEENADVKLTAAEFKHFLISEAIGTLYGNVGCAIHFDLLYYNEDSCEAIIRLKTSDYQKVWAALTLLAFYKEYRCVVRVIKVSGHLIGINHTRHDDEYTDLISS